MDGPAMMIAVTMVAAGALATLVGLAVAGLFWQAEPGEPATDPAEPAPAARVPHQRRPGAGRSALVSHR
ncbi:MAG TPA: hypothetical protein VHA75_17350, partial [Rugosimonospora sp.]|nr:hypothetical protein [Rugosimonospora sp.]